MVRRAAAEVRQTYLIEHYRPGLQVEGLRCCAERVRETVGEMELEGKPVHYVRSTIVPADESLLCILEAASQKLVQDAYARARIPFERLSVVISEEEWRREEVEPY
jgi:hypothetical protein